MLVSPGVGSGFVLSELLDPEFQGKAVEGSLLAAWIWKTHFGKPIWKTHFGKPILESHFRKPSSKGLLGVQYG
jgi:hypothetical protein